MRGYNEVLYFQNLLSSVKGQQMQIEDFGDQAQVLTQVASEPRVSAYGAQLNTRYQTLRASTKVDRHFPQHYL